MKDDAKFFELAAVLMVVFVVAGFALGYQWCESDMKMKYVADTQKYRADMLKMKADWVDLYVKLQERAKAKGIEL